MMGIRRRNRQEIEIFQFPVRLISDVLLERSYQYKPWVDR